MFSIQLAFRSPHLVYLSHFLRLSFIGWEVLCSDLQLQGPYTLFQFKIVNGSFVFRSTQSHRSVPDVAPAWVERRIIYCALSMNVQRVSVIFNSRDISFQESHLLQQEVYPSLLREKVSRIGFEAEPLKAWYQSFWKTLKMDNRIDLSPLRCGDNLSLSQRL